MEHFPPNKVALPEIWVVLYPMPSLYWKNCSHLLIEFLRPSSVQWLLATITTIGGMPFSTGICPEPGGEPKIIQLGCFPVRSSIVTRVGKYASFAIFFDGLNFKVLENMESTAGDQLQKKKIKNDKIRKTVFLKKERGLYNVYNK